MRCRKCGGSGSVEHGQDLLQCDQCLGSGEQPLETAGQAWGSRRGALVICGLGALAVLAGGAIHFGSTKAHLVVPFVVSGAMICVVGVLLLKSVGR